MAVALRDLERGHARGRPALRVIHSAPAVPPTPPSVFWLRRMLVLTAIAAIVAGTIVAVRATASSASPAARIEMTVVVSEGETLWDIARRYAPAGADRSAWAADVATRNALDPATVRPGTPVVVPIEGQRVLAAPRRPAGR